MASYRNEVKTVVSRGMCVGFIVRSTAIFGLSSDTVIDWCATPTLLAPMWKSGFKTRKQAREYLEGLYYA